MLFETSSEIILKQKLIGHDAVGNENLVPALCNIEDAEKKLHKNKFALRYGKYPNKKNRSF